MYASERGFETMDIVSLEASGSMIVSSFEQFDKTFDTFLTGCSIPSGSAAWSSPQA